MVRRRVAHSSRAVQVGLGAVLALTWLVAVLSYSLSREETVQVGNAADVPLVAGFNADEADTGYRYRWSKDRSEVHFGWTGDAPARTVQVVAQGFRPQSSPAPATMSVLVDGVPLDPAVMTLTNKLATYTFTVPASTSLQHPSTVTLVTSTFSPPGDTRHLGAKVASVRLVQAGDGLNLPPLDLFLWLALLTLGLFYLLMLVPGYMGAILATAGALMSLGAFGGFRVYAPVYLPALAAVLAVVALLHWQRAHVASWPGWIDRLGEVALARRVMLAALVLFAGFCIWVLPQVDWIGHADYAENAVIARNFAGGRGLTVDYVAQFYDPHPSLTHPAETWPLLQPLLIAPFFTVLGPVTWVAKLPNLILVILLAGLVFALASRLWDARVGLLAGLLTLVHPYFFNAVLYPINDLAFTAIFFALGWLVWRVVLPGGSREPEASPAEPMHKPRSVWLQPRPGSTTLRAAGVGVLAGLLIWSKPSGAALLLGLALWAAWVWMRTPRTARTFNLRGLVPAVAAFALVLGPLWVRNFLAFGKPFFSTEGYDAWILRYWPGHEWEDIYKVYVGKEPPSFRWVVGGKFGYDTLFRAVWTNIEAVWRRGVLGEQGSSDFVFGLLPLLGAAIGLASATRRVGRLFGLVWFCLALYALFVLGYWHYEGRYFQLAVPWLYMLLAWGLLWLWDRLRGSLQEGLGRRWGLLLLPLALVALVWPQLDAIATQVQADVQPTGFVAAMRWLKDNSKPSDVVMTRDPWELNWYAERKAVMIPFDDLSTVNSIARQYGATYLQLGGPVDGIDVSRCPDPGAKAASYPTGIRPIFGSLYCGIERPGYRLVYRAGGLTIYRLVAQK